MSSLQNDRYLRALRRQPVDYTPIWVMRQAGRYLPEYRATRKQAGNFLNLCKSPDLACEVTLQPIDRFGLDAAILFSDILTIPDAMGLGLVLEEGIGPVFERPLRSEREIRNLSVPDPEQDLGYVMDAVRTIRQALQGRVPLIGFTGSPWTLATYMVEGKGSKEFRYIKGLMYESPEVLHHLLQVTTDAVIQYLQAQVAAGAQSLMVFDTWGGTLPFADYREFSLAYLAQIVEGLRALPDPAPVTLFSKGAQAHLEAMADTGCQGLGLDWTASLAHSRKRVGERVALQGNLDPSALRAKPAALRNMVALTLADYGRGPGHVFNLGHGITPDADPENVQLMIDTVRETRA